MSDRMVEVIKPLLSDIKPGKYQPRQNIDNAHIEATADSMNSIGLQDPVVIRELVGEAGKYELVAGEYRWRAALKLGWERIEALLKTDCDKNIAVGAITSNGSLPLNAIDLAVSYSRLIAEFDMTHAEIAIACGKGRNRAHVTKTLRLLQLPVMVKNYIVDGSLSPTHAQVLLESPERYYQSLADQCVEFGWSVSKLKQEVNSLLEGNKDQAPKQDKTSEWLQLEMTMTEQIGLPLAIKPKGGKKQQKFHVELQCDSPEKLEQLLSHLQELEVVQYEYQE